MKVLNRIEEILLAGSLISVTLVLFINIILRYFFSANTTWAEEFIRYVMIWITFIGCAVCFSRKLHVGIDFFLEFAPRKLKESINFVVNFICIILMIFLIYYGFELVKFSFNSGQITPSLQMEMFWIYLAIPVGAVLSLIHLIFNVTDILGI